MPSTPAPEAALAGEARARLLDEALEQLGYDFFTGVPCSLLASFYRVLSDRGRDYYPATREDLALGLAAGAALGGRRAVVLMQNSGLGVSVNALMTLQQMYQLPVLLVVTWRGHVVEAPEHVQMGRLLPSLLRSLAIPSRLLTDGDAFDARLHAQRRPVALVVRPGELE